MDATGDIIKGLTKDTDREQAWRLANDIARLLGGAVTHKERLILGEPFCPFQVSMPDRDFKCVLSVSDRSYSFEAEHRRGSKAVPKGGAFCAGLRAPIPHMFCTALHAGASQAVGVPVYTQPWTDAERLSVGLLKEPVLQILRRVDYAPLRRFFLSPVQLEVQSLLTSPSEAVAQVRLFKALIVTFFGGFAVPKRERKGRGSRDQGKGAGQ